NTISTADFFGMVDALADSLDLPAPFLTVAPPPAVAGPRTYDLLRATSQVVGICSAKAKKTKEGGSSVCLSYLPEEERNTFRLCSPISPASGRAVHRWPCSPPHKGGYVPYSRDDISPVCASASITRYHPSTLRPTNRKTPAHVRTSSAVMSHRTTSLLRVGWARVVWRRSA